MAITAGSVKDLANKSFWLAVASENSAARFCSARATLRSSQAGVMPIFARSSLGRMGALSAETSAATSDGSTRCPSQRNSPFSWRMTRAAFCELPRPPHPERISTRLTCFGDWAADAESHNDARNIRSNDAVSLLCNMPAIIDRRGWRWKWSVHLNNA